MVKKVKRKRRAKSEGERKPERRELVRNRKAFYEFEILERFQAGIILLGTEVKSIREGNVSLDESYVRVENGEAWWVKGHIREYAFGNRMNHEPDRKRKLLLRRRELRKLYTKVRQRGLTLVPLVLYLNERNLVKVELGLCRGKKLHDKREAQREKDARREIRKGGD